MPGSRRPWKLRKKKPETKRPRRRKLEVLETVQVLGSQGNRYEVKILENGKARCPCKGFSYRSECRHVLDPEVQQFFREKNPWALRNIIERLMESVDRGLWQQPDEQQLEQMRRVYLQLEGELEERMDTSEGQQV